MLIETFKTLESSWHHRKLKKMLSSLNRKSCRVRTFTLRVKVHIGHPTGLRTKGWLASLANVTAFNRTRAPAIGFLSSSPGADRPTVGREFCRSVYLASPRLSPPPGLRGGCCSCCCYFFLPYRSVLSSCFCLSRWSHTDASQRSLMRWLVNRLCTILWLSCSRINMILANFSTSIGKRFGWKSESWKHETAINNGSR